MIIHQHRVSLGALALVACLALPAGLLSLLSDSTTGEQVDAADLIVAGRVSSVQIIDSPQRTSIEFAVDHSVFGAWTAPTLTLSVEGRVAVDVGDEALVITRLRPASMLGVYAMRKNPTLLDDEIVTPVTGMMAQGIAGDRSNPVPLSLFEAAVHVRRGGNGMAGASQSGGTLGMGTASRGPQDLTGVGPDAFERNNTLATATPISGLHPPTLLTGNPLVLTGLTITPNDVDFFAFDAGALQIVHAATLPVTGLDSPDTLIGLFDVATGKLLAHDDDSGGGKLSQLAVPLEKSGKVAVAVESAPDPNLTFDGSQGATTGTYNLSLELELGSYLWNQLDLIMGVSPDGTFIEDGIGFKQIGSTQDILLAGVPADGWALDFDVGSPPTGVTHVYGGAGDQLSDPGFTNPLALLSFDLGPLVDGSGMNRRGESQASAMVTYDTGATGPGLGVIANTDYKVSVGASTVIGDIALQMGTHAPVKNLKYTRVLDVDLFDPATDQFFWSFNPTGKIKAFPVDASTNVGNVTRPAQSFGEITGDMQAALVIDHGSSNGMGFGDVTHYKCAFTYVRGFANAQLALNDAVRRLRHVGIDTWVVAVNVDPDTGLFAAFGSGLGNP